MQRLTVTHCLQPGWTWMLGGWGVHACLATHMSPLSPCAGILFAYFSVAAICWCMTLVLVPSFEKTLLELNAITTTGLTMLTAAYVTASAYLGTAVHDQFYDKVLVYVSGRGR